MEPAAYVTTLDDDALEALHKHLDTSTVDDPAAVEAHHVVASEMLKRGLDHGHDENDPWSLSVIVTDQAVVKSAYDLDLPAGMDKEPFEELLKDGGVLTVLLTTNGYVIKAEEGYDPLNDVSDRDVALYEAYESIAEEFGLWQQGDAHYMSADDNPFQHEGMNCANCVFYEGAGGCEIVSEQVDPMGLCKLWIIPQDLMNHPMESDDEEYDLMEYLPDGTILKYSRSIAKGDRSAAGRRAAEARWGNRGGDERAAAGSGSGPPPPDGPRRPGMGDAVPISDEDFDMLKAGSAGPHVIGRMDDGAPIFTPERQALHDAMVLEHVSGVPASSDPTYHLMGGGPAAGKSSAIKSGIVDVPGKDKAVQINADDIKYRTDDDGNPVGTSLVDADGISGRKDWAGHTHEESSYLAKRIQAAAVERGQDMVLDGTGNNKASSVQGKIAGARAAGYVVKGHYVTCPTQDAVGRAATRAERTGRVVPEAVIRGTHAGVSRVVPEVASSFDSFTLVDTSGSSPRKVASATRGESITVDDQGLWDAFLAKGNE